jgi:phage terminase large subunit-like protein
MSEFYNDIDAGNRAVRFFETQVRLVEGNAAGQAFRLQPWQAKIVRDVFGWKRSNGTRRYRTVYVEVPRKNGKSTLAAGLALYLLLCDDEQRPQVYSAAGDRGQARIVFDAARAMCRANERIMGEVRLLHNRITSPKAGGWYEALSAEAYTKHGLSASGIIFDELHVQPNRELWDVLTTSVGARLQPLTIAITTAGHDRSSICWEMHQRAKAAIANPENDPHFYGVIFGAEQSQDWKNEDVWRQANPNYGVSLTPDYMREKCNEAIANPSAENAFRNLHLNQWTEQSIRWLPLDAWDKCQHEANISEFSGERCWAALDLASTRDINALTLLFKRDDKFYLFNRYWMPQEPRDIRGKQDRTQAKNWAEQGLIKATDGDVADYGVIVNDLCDLAQSFDVQILGYDPWGPARSVAQMLASSGFPAEKLREFRQTVGAFAVPSKEFERRIANQTIHHDGDPVLRWMVGNVAAERDRNDNIRPSKSRSADKIDGVVTGIMALGLAMLDEGEQHSVYETQGSLTL